MPAQSSIVTLGLAPVVLACLAAACSGGPSTNRVNGLASEGISVDDTGGNPTPPKPVKPPTPAPTTYLNGYRGVALGGNTTYALGNLITTATDTGQLVVYSLGYNGDYELGVGTTTSSNLPVLTLESTANQPVSLAAGNTDACALMTNGTVECWGTLVTLPAAIVNTTPAAIALPAGVVVAQLVHGQTHACALSTSTPAAIYCWGNNDKSQLGDATNAAGRATPYKVPLTLPSGVNVAAIAAGGRATCALASNGTIWCWGDNERGSLGNARGVLAPVAGSSSSYTATPQQVVAPVDPFGDLLPTFSLPADVPAGNPVLLGGGAGTFCAQTASGWYCWGANDSGQAGVAIPTTDGGVVHLTIDLVSPEITQSGVNQAPTIALGLNHSCAIGGGTGGGDVQCYGANNDGQLGSGVTNASPVPAPTNINESQIGAYPSPFTLMAVGNNHSCGIDGIALCCWGDDTYGQVGALGSDSSLLPINLDVVP